MHQDVDPKNVEKANVISLSQWRNEKAQESESESLKRYMNVLSFHDLIHESQGVIAEIKSSNVNQDLQERSKGLLDEFHNRLASEEPSDWSRALGEMKKRLEKTLAEFGKIF